MAAKRQLRKQLKPFGKEVRKALIDREWTVARLADHLGYHRTSISFAIHGLMDLPPCRRAIAKELGINQALAQ